MPRISKSEKATKAAQAHGNGKPQKSLRPLQVRVLSALAEADGPLTRRALYDALGFKSQSGLNDVLGKNDPKIRAATDKKKYPSLLTLGYIKQTRLEIESDGPKENVYEITDSGKKAI